MCHSKPDQKRNKRFGHDEPQRLGVHLRVSASMLKCAFEALTTARIHFIGPLKPKAIKTFKKQDHMKFTISIMAQGAGDMPTKLYKQNF